MEGDDEGAAFSSPAGAPPSSRLASGSSPASNEVSPFGAGPPSQPALLSSTSPSCCSPVLPAFSCSPSVPISVSGVENGVAPPPLTGTNKRSLAAMEQGTSQPLDSSARRALLGMVPPQVARPGRCNVVTENIT
ncbi:conserved hypothetical protein [Neospora caninum Liverpool]|uniref:Uncharacterized protein n=1 Tax=Neospora caninum (strain Liverpool) TaxID=572307 RepID=F0VMT8_NEOCL|nr:conserved hypothetical protein [Neospora caninum Liverpool]CBZ55034.1 conserved hypothetical protein [Neospora caninum Liverpool]CEL69759.1 TPA: hypothetical protein BN1204_054590 [Neospora caninum Liverpool]|eukprot:XP_003885062.1 conserved hypothetical protein [Neospora caninum Liverpool]